MDPTRLIAIPRGARETPTWNPIRIHEDGEWWRGRMSGRREKGNDGARTKMWNGGRPQGSSFIHGAFTRYPCKADLLLGRISLLSSSWRRTMEPNAPCAVLHHSLVRWNGSGSGGYNIFLEVSFSSIADRDRCCYAVTSAFSLSSSWQLQFVLHEVSFTRPLLLNSVVLSQTNPRIHCSGHVYTYSAEIRPEYVVLPVSLSIFTLLALALRNYYSNVVQFISLPKRRTLYYIT